MTNWLHMFNSKAKKRGFTDIDHDKSDKVPRKKQFAGISIRLVQAICFSLVMTLLSLDISNIDFDFWPQLVVSSGVIILLAAITWFWQAVLIVLGISALSFLVFWLIGYPLIERLQELVEFPSFWLEEAFYWLIAQPNYFPLDTLPVLGLVIGALIAIGCYWLVARTCHPWFMLIAIIGIVFARQALNLDYKPIVLLFGFIVVLLSFALKQPGWNRNTRPRLITIQSPLLAYSILPVISALLVAVLLAQVISPTIITAVRRPQEWENIASMLTMPGMKGSGPGTEFSIGTSGYYPLQNRLGGSVSLSSDPVFSVTGPADDMLFKGAISTNYSGNSWQRIPMDTGKKFDDPIFARNREDIMGINHLNEFYANLYVSGMSIPFEEFTAEELEEISNMMTIDGSLAVGDVNTLIYDVEFEKQGFRSVFYQGLVFDVLLQLESRASEQGFDLFSELVQFDPTLYYNDGGAIYTSTPFSPGQGYSVVAMDYQLDENIFPYWYRAVYGVDTASLDFNPEDLLSSIGDQRYLQLPDIPEYSVNSELQQMARDLTAGKKTQFERAKALESFLKGAATYSLEVEMPPADREFVTWFLEQEEGYCVYFATALTMLCRLAGIPARYVEGYYVPRGSTSYENDLEINDEINHNISRVITGQQAHAWTEVYIENIGWMTLDATPGGGSAAAEQIAQDMFNPYTEMTTPSETDISNQNDQNDNANIYQRDDSWSGFFYQLADRFLPFMFFLVSLVLLVILMRLWLLRLRRLFAENWWLNKHDNIRIRIKTLFSAMLRLMPEQDQLWENGQAWSEFAENSKYHIFSITNGTIDAHEWENISKIINEALYSDHKMKDKQWSSVWHAFSCMVQGMSEKRFGTLRICIDLLPLMPLLRRSKTH